MMDAGEGVVVTVVASEPEARIACGLLSSAGIDCAYRETDAIDAPFEAFSADGPREIIVDESDLEAARELLAGTG
jgi:putative signal transducing protein